MFIARLQKNNKVGGSLLSTFLRNKDLIAKIVKVVHGATGAATLAAGAYGVKKLIDNSRDFSGDAKAVKKD